MHLQPTFQFQMYLLQDVLVESSPRELVADSVNDLQDVLKSTTAKGKGRAQGVRHKKGQASPDPVNILESDMDRGVAEKSKRKDRKRKGKARADKSEDEQSSKSTSESESSEDDSDSSEGESDDLEELAGENAASQSS
jgi:hypothetical protein